MDLRSRLGSGRADATGRQDGARRRPFGAPGHGPLRLLAVATVTLALTTACGDDDEPTADDESSATTATTPATTAAPSDEEPPGTDPDAVEPYVADLLTRYDEVTAQILADPEIAASTEHPLYGELGALMDPSSEMTSAIVETLVSRGEDGVALLPHGDATLPVLRSVDGDIETVSEEQVRFPLCTRYDYRLVTDSRIELGDGHDRRSEGTAVRIDGHWVVSRLEGNDEIVDCAEPA